MTIPHGMIPPLVTPLLARDRLDVEGLERLVEHVLGGGCSGVFVLGTTGEGPSLGNRLQRDLVERACRIVGGRAPVLVGITHPSLEESLSLARFSAEAGAAAVVAAPPYYYPVGQADLAVHFERLADESPLPLALYNIPSCARTSIGLETCLRLFERPKVVAFKDSSGDLIYFQRVLQLAGARKLPVFMGPEELTAQAVLLGAAGGVNAGANLRPRLHVDLFEAAAAGDLAKLRVLQPKVLAGSEAIYGVSRGPSSLLQGLKTALHHTGLCSDFLAPPYSQFSAADRKAFVGRLVDMGIAS